MKAKFWFVLACWLWAGAARANDIVLVLSLRGEVNPPMERYVRLALAQAEKGPHKVAALVVDMDTYGGALVNAEAIRTLLLEAKQPVWVFVNKNAASAGALIALSCDRIYMQRGASIGAATVVNGSGGDKAPDKYQSYMRGMMRATAEANGRNPRIAEAMVDENVSLDSLKQPGQVLTLTTAEALKWGYCDAQASSLTDILALNGLAKAQIEHFELGTAERIIAFFMNPAISGLLILLILGGLFVEIKTPGVGLPLLVSIVATLLYFVPYYLNGLAAHWEIIAFFIGLVLVLAEVFVLPGFGVAGIAGIALVAFSLVAAMVNNQWFDFSAVSADELLRAVVATVLGLAGGIGAILFVASQIFKTRFYKRVALQEALDAHKGYAIGHNLRPLVGLRARAHTVLRPGGKVILNGQLYDAFTRSGFVEQGSEVEIIDVESGTLKVKEVTG